MASTNSSAVNASNFVSVKLSRVRDNFSIWKPQMLCLVESQGLMGFIADADGSSETEPKQSESHHSSFRTDRLVKGWILGSLGEDILKKVVNLETARDVWLELHRIFGLRTTSSHDDGEAKEESASDRSRHDFGHLYPYPSAINVGNFVSVELTAENYSLWRAQMLCLIEGQELLGFIDGRIPPPEKDGGGETEYMAWRRTDLLVKGWIFGSLSEPVMNRVKGLSTAKDVWSKLARRYGDNSDADLRPAGPDVEEQLEEDIIKYLPLHRAAVHGDWGKAKAFLDSNNGAITARITYDRETVLHVAVANRKAIPFLQKLLEQLPKEALKIKDVLGDTALARAAVVGNIEAVKILVGEDPDLLYIPNKNGYFPVMLAAMYSRRDVLEYMLSVTKVDPDHHPSPYAGKSGPDLLVEIIYSEYFDLALDLVQKYPNMATMASTANCYAVIEMAIMSSVYRSGCRFNFWQSFVYSRVPIKSREKVQKLEWSDEDLESTLDLPTPPAQPVKPKLHHVFWLAIENLVPQVKSIRVKKSMHRQVIKFVECLCEKMESMGYDKALSVLTGAIIRASSCGIHEIIEIIVDRYPLAVFSYNNEKKYMFHLAVENRCENVFNLIYQMGDSVSRFSSLQDVNKNTLLHLAGRLAPPFKLNRISGAALQLQRELQWFKEVEKWVPASWRNSPNAERKTADMIFTEEHKKLKEDGEKWMKDTANSCTISAALIVTIVFAAAITVPGGNTNDNGFPAFLSDPAFKIFAISDAISLFTSATSLLMFLSILTSRYAEEDFLYTLPKRLILGLVTLFLSITFMIIAFSVTVYMVFGHRKAWILIPVGALACLPITSFVLLQFPLLLDIASYTYGPGIFGRQSNHPFFS